MRGSLKGCAVTEDEARTVILIPAEEVGETLNCLSVQVQVALHKICCMYEVTLSLQTSLSFPSLSILSFNLNCLILGYGEQICSPLSCLGAAVK